MLSGTLSGAASISADLGIRVALDAAISGATTVSADLSVSWVPSDLSNVAAWFRADLGHTASDGGAVSAWSNQISGGSAWDLSQGTGSLQPTFDEDLASANNQSSISFDGGDTLESATGSAWEVADDGDHTTVAVIRPRHSSGITNVMGTDNNANGGWYTRSRVSGGNTVCFIFDSTGAFSRGTAGLMTQNVTDVLATEFTGQTSPTNDAFIVSVGGTSGAADNDDLGAIVPSGGSGSENFIVGNNATGTGNFDGDIMEIIVIDGVLSSGDESDLVDYLNDRYNLSLTAVI